MFFPEKGFIDFIACMLLLVLMEVFVHDRNKVEDQSSLPQGGVRGCEREMNPANHLGST